MIFFFFFFLFCKILLPVFAIALSYSCESAGFKQSQNFPYAHAFSSVFKCHYCGRIPYPPANRLFSPTKTYKVTNRHLQPNLDQFLRLIFTSIIIGRHSYSFSVKFRFVEFIHNKLLCYLD